MSNLRKYFTRINTIIYLPIKFLSQMSDTAEEAKSHAHLLRYAALKSDSGHTGRRMKILNHKKLKIQILLQRLYS